MTLGNSGIIPVFLVLVMTELGCHATDVPGIEKYKVSLQSATQCPTWNIRNLTPGKLNVITAEMERCGFSICQASEHWWTDQKRILTMSGHMFYFSGKHHMRIGEAGFLMSKAVLRYNSVNDRIITLRINAQSVNIMFVQVYAPTADAAKEEVDRFYKIVKEALDKIPN